MKGAVILIERQDMKGTYKGAKTDKKGHYIYNGLPFPGTYTVSVFVDGQKKDETERRENPAGRSGQHIVRSEAERRATAEPRKQPLAAGAAPPRSKSAG